MVSTHVEIHLSYESTISLLDIDQTEIHPYGYLKSDREFHSSIIFSGPKLEINQILINSKMERLHYSHMIECYKARK